MLILVLLATFALSSFALYIFVINFLKIQQLPEKNVIFFISLGVGPVFMSWLLEKIMYFFQGFGSGFYLITILTLFFIPAFFYFKDSSSFKNISNIFIFYKYKSIFTIMLISFSSYFIMLLPPSGNDPLEYFTVSRIIFDSKTFDIYPLINSELGVGYFPWTHPTGYVGLIVWSYLIQGTAEYAGIAKIISPYYFFCMIALLSYLSYIKSGKIAVYTSIILLLATPLYVNTFLIFHIDPIRLFTFFVPLIFLSINFKTITIRHFTILGLFIGISMHSHSIGAISIIYTIFFLFTINSWKNSLQLKHIATMLTIVALIISMRYYDSYQKLGYMLGDHTQLWSIEDLHYDEYLEESRDLNFLENRLFNGVLKGFTHITELGFIHWLFLLITLASLYEICKVKTIPFYQLYQKILAYDTLLVISTFVVLLWYLATLFFTILGRNMFIQNDRYLLTIFPFIIYIISSQFSYFHKKYL